MTEKYIEAPDRVVYEYLYTYGGLSPFFREIIDNQRLMGTKCKKCGFVYCPPRVHCGQCYTETEWVPLSNEGTVEASTYVAFVPRKDPVRKYLDVPYLLAMIRLDGADTPLLNVVHIENPRLGQVKPGMRVRAVFREKLEGSLTDFYFVPI